VGCESHETKNIRSTSNRSKSVWQRFTRYERAEHRSERSEKFSIWIFVGAERRTSQRSDFSRLLINSCYRRQQMRKQEQRFRHSYARRIKGCHSVVLGTPMSEDDLLPVLFDVERPLEFQVGVVVIIDKFGDGSVMAASNHSAGRFFRFNCRF